MSKLIPRKIKKACKEYRNYVPLKTKWLRYVHTQVLGRMVIDCYTTYGWIFVRGDGYRCAIDDELLEGEIIGNIHDNPELMKGGSNEA